jgi:hypothetical protein
MAIRYFVTGNPATTAAWSATNGGAGGASIPTINDTCYITKNRTGSWTPASNYTLTCQDFIIEPDVTITAADTFLGTYRVGNTTTGVGKLWLLAPYEHANVSNCTFNFNGNHIAFGYGGGTAALNISRLNINSSCKWTILGPDTNDSFAYFTNTSLASNIVATFSTDIIPEYPSLIPATAYRQRVGTFTSGNYQNPGSVDITALKSGTVGDILDASFSTLTKEATITPSTSIAFINRDANATKTIVFGSTYNNVLKTSGSLAATVVLRYAIGDNSASLIGDWTGISDVRLIADTNSNLQPAFPIRLIGQYSNLNIVSNTHAENITFANTSYYSDIPVIQNNFSGNLICGSPKVQFPDNWGLILTGNTEQTIQLGNTPVNLQAISRKNGGKVSIETYAGQNIKLSEKGTAYSRYFIKGNGGFSLGSNVIVASTPDNPEAYNVANTVTWTQNTFKFIEVFDVAEEYRSQLNIKDKAVLPFHPVRLGDLTQVLDTHMTLNTPQNWTGTAPWKAKHLWSDPPIDYESISFSSGSSFVLVNGYARTDAPLPRDKYNYVEYGNYLISMHYPHYVDAITNEVMASDLELNTQLGDTGLWVYSNNCNAVYKADRFEVTQTYVGKNILDEDVNGQCQIRYSPSLNTWDNLSAYNVLNFNTSLQNHNTGVSQGYTFNIGYMYYAGYAENKFILGNWNKDEVHVFGSLTTQIDPNKAGKLVLTDESGIGDKLINERGEFVDLNDILPIIDNSTFTNFYVDAVNGSDTNDGRAADRAWKSLQTAFDAVSNKKYIYPQYINLAPGTYTKTSDFTLTRSDSIITIRGDSTDRSLVKITRGMVINHCNRVELADFTGSGSPSSVAWLRMQYLNHINISNCDIAITVNYAALQISHCARFALLNSNFSTTHASGSSAYGARFSNCKGYILNSTIKNANPNVTAVNLLGMSIVGCDTITWNNIHLNKIPYTVSSGSQLIPDGLDVNNTPKSKNVTVTSDGTQRLLVPHNLNTVELGTVTVYKNNKLEYIMWEVNDANSIALLFETPTSNETFRVHFTT